MFVSAERKAQRVFIASIGRLLQNGQIPNALWAAKKTSRAQTSISLMQSYYEKSINTFINHGALKEAHQLYRREITDGMVPSTSVTSHLLRAWGKEPEKAPYIMKTIGKVLVRKPLLWDEGLLCTLLSNLISARRFGLLEDTVNSYAALSKARGYDWKPGPVVCATMVRGYALAGWTEKALRWLQIYREACREQGRSTGRIDTTLCYAIVKQMIEDEVPLHISVFNLLLALENRNSSTGRTFALFRILERRLTKLGDATPDRFPLSTPQEHCFERCSFFITPIAFLKVRDYAAATVVLRTFAVCRLLPNTDTEWAITSHTLRRMEAELSMRPELTGMRWVDNMQGDIIPSSEAVQERQRIRSILESIKDDAQPVIDDSMEIIFEGTGTWAASLMSKEASDHPKAEGAPLRPVHKERQPQPVSITRLLGLVHRIMTADLFIQTHCKGDPQAHFEAAMAQANSEMLPPKRQIQ
ncbi:hypothetical protein FS837_000386 [Tulasnella sp. UAMH 9824]|nr:hypothetical protein FS837_000386 [Tulasnella sp. UAMH 9824]